MFTCPNCGGRLKYSIKYQKLKCESCDSLFDPEEYTKDNSASASASAEEEKEKDGDTYDTYVYTCRHCGAQLTSPEDQIVSFCPYCGYESVLKQKISNEQRPKKIIPFAVTRSECREKYGEFIRKMPFVPDDIRKPEKLSEFRGIYIPYFLYRVSFPDDNRIPVEISYVHASGNLRTVKTYQREYELSGGAPYIRDASSSLDDRIMAEIGQYRLPAWKDFCESYLAGFYADRADLLPAVYEADIKAELNNDIQNAFPSGSIVKGSFSAKWHADRTLFPVWFLTYRNKNRVSYIVMNGQNGALHTELPADKKKFMRTAGILAIFIMVLLMLLPAATVTTMAGIMTLFSALVSIVFCRELGRLAKKESRTGDIGYISKYGTREQKIRERKLLRRRHKVRPVSYYLRIIFLLALIFPAANLVLFPVALAIMTADYGFPSFSSNYYSMAVALSAVSLVISAAAGIVSTVHATKTSEKELAFRAWILVIPTAAVLICSACHVPNDAVYYILSILCPAAGAYTAFSLIDVYNLTASRPIPNYFDRQGGDNNAEDE